MHCIKCVCKQHPVDKGPGSDRAAKCRQQLSIQPDRQGPRCFPWQFEPLTSCRFLSFVIASQSSAITVMADGDDDVMDHPADGR